MMQDPHDRTEDLQKLADGALIAELVAEFKSEWGSGEHSKIESYLERVPSTQHSQLLVELIASEIELRCSVGETVVVDAYTTRFMEHGESVRDAFSLAEGRTTRAGVDKTLEVPRDPLADAVDKTATLPSLNVETLPVDGPPSNDRFAGKRTDKPSRLGRYRIEKVLGQGGFGKVFLAHDEELQRQVAIKMAAKAVGEEEAQQYLAEARTVATLEHPQIVPVYDVGRAGDGQLYVVSKLVDGGDLADRIKTDPLPPRQSADLIAALADALQYAHDKGLVHRDIKPGNVLLDRQGQAFLCDFGLALREDEFGQGPTLAGTPAYMSPEQARGEGHRVDGRSDIYSLGVVLYELLTGRRPFLAGSLTELLRSVAQDEPHPPCQIQESVPRELERITLKCLAKRTSDRYNSASDLAQDLRAFLDDRLDIQKKNAKVVPKGLQSFDASDSEFFLELLPGPSDRNGLPNSIVFWKSRFEERDSDQTFGVGLIYGPSGCGKSSLLKAGLLPQLAENVRPIYVEATPDETESRLLAGLRKACPELPTDVSLKDAVALLRQGQKTRSSRKIVLIIDQFEQWLHARYDYAGTELADSLRQCDGGNIQAVLMVRDDFWLAVSRLFLDLDIRLIEGHNSGLVDLFDLLHARKVLAEFGRAYGCLPENLGKLSGEQERFLEDSVTGLATDGKVISVRLALFSLMVKGKPWTPETLRQLGGISGVGVAFLEQTFSSQNALPQHRHHQQAARDVLRDLLPGEGTDIKGHWRSRAQLREASGYQHRPQDFDDLLRILETELRLITPTDPEGIQDDSAEPSTVETEPLLYYQLTHDYLVPALRDWLTRKQKETRRGRAELKLDERASLWNAKPEKQQLPSLLEHVAIRTLTDRQKWTEPQRRMMHRIGKLHAVRIATVGALLLVVAVIGLTVRSNFLAREKRQLADSLVQQILTADLSAVRSLVQQLDEEGLRPLANSELRKALELPADEPARLRASMVLVKSDDNQLDALRFAILKPDLPYADIGVLVDAIAHAGNPAAVADLIDTLRSDFETSESVNERFRAGLALATLAPSSVDSTESSRKFMTEQLLASNPEHHQILRSYLKPIADLIVPSLESLYSDGALPDIEQLGAVNALADFSGHDGPSLARMLSVANPEHYKLLYEKLDRLEDSTAKKTLLDLMGREPTDEMTQAQRIALGRARAGAAITLLRLGAREEMLDVFRVDEDPESLTQFVHLCRDREIAPQVLLDCLDRAANLQQAATDKSSGLEDRVLFGLLLALGEFSLDELPEAERQPWVDRLAVWYASNPSSAIHGATGWLLRHWGATEIARRVDQTVVPYTAGRQWFTLEVATTKENPDIAEQTIYMTFVVFEPGEYEIGSPEDEPGHEVDETSHTVHLTYPFAIADREVSWLAFARFYPGLADGMMNAAADALGQRFSLDHPVILPHWYDSVLLCRWLTETSGLSEDEQAYPKPESLDKEKHPPDPNPEARGLPLYWPLVALDRPGFRLPTEAEWEVACRAGTRVAWSYGSDLTWANHYSWNEENSNRLTHATRMKRPNLRGLFDMHGSALEWTHDIYEKFTSAEQQNPTGPEAGAQYVLRGGTYTQAAWMSRSARRQSNHPYFRSPNLGVRVVVGLPDHEGTVDAQKPSNRDAEVSADAGPDDAEAMDADAMDAEAMDAEAMDAEVMDAEVMDTGDAPQ